MIHDIKLTFSGNPLPVFLPVTETEAVRVRELLTDRTDSLGFIQCATVFGQDVFLNFSRIVMINFLLEPHVPLIWNEDDIAPSVQHPEEDDIQPEYDSIRWDLLIYLVGTPAPLHILDCNGHDWVEITTSIDCDEQFIVTTDEDGEDLAIAIDKIDLIIGTEVNRYSQKQIELIDTTMMPEPGH